jgi:ribosome maturation factor RimP
MGLADPLKWSQIRSLAEAVVKDHFLELFDLEVRSQGGKRVLSVVLDKASGKVGLKDCESVSRELEKRLDELDAWDGAYLLEVSSPGLDRPLRHAGDYSRFEGRLALLTLSQPLEGMVSFEGRLSGVEQDQALVRVGKERLLRVPIASIKAARLVIEL